jgi:hypothetical protein
VRKLLKIELRRAFASPALWAALLVGLAIVVVQYAQDVLPMVNYLNLSVGGKELGMYPHSVFNKWIGGGMGSFTPYLYFLLLPLLATIPFGGSFYEDLNSGLVKNLFIKTEKKNYYGAKYLTVFLSGGFVILIPLLVNLALTAATLPSLLPEVGTQQFPLFATSIGASLFYSHPYGFVFAYLLLIFVFSGFLATIALCVSFYVKNRFVVVLSPFILCLFVHSLCQLLGNSSLDPTDFLNPSNANTTLPLVLGELIVIAILTVFLFAVKGSRDDTF